ncbi:hypothetical protein AC1031_010529 [Aphanomyces cochlioides]|nr:hypothetical protein AC1031_010529 [Aphanomyces cochlioides]
MSAPSDVPEMDVAGYNDDSTFSWNEILHVQNLIERCLQQSMSQNDIINALQAQANVDPNFTRTVWQKLEEQNPSFFEAYALHLTLKEQILTFNYLVNQQREMSEGGQPALMVESKSAAEIPRVMPSTSSMAPLLSPIKNELDTCAFFT